MKSDQKNKGILINLKVVLDKKNMTKKELAKKMNTSIGVVNRYYSIKKQYENLVIRINTGLITLYQGRNQSIYY